MPIISIAPMIDISNHHFRAFMRILSRKAVLYTEMKSTKAIIHNHAKILPFQEKQRPIILQIGGSDPHKLAQAAKIGQRYGYDQINLNVGCPSSKVQQDNFGAILMKQPQLVRQCLRSMLSAVSIPCSIKCRIGVDNHDEYEFLRRFVGIVSDNGSTSKNIRFIVHARKAILNGLNPCQNRTVPPLDYNKVYSLKNDFKNLNFELNGGIKKIEQGCKLVKQHNLQGFMVGRLAIQNPYQLRNIDLCLGKIDQMEKIQNIDQEHQDRLKYILQYAQYLRKLENRQVKDIQGNPIQSANLFTLIKPIINFYHGQLFGSKFRRHLSDLSKFKDKDAIRIIEKAALSMYQVSKNPIQDKLKQVKF